MLELTVYAVCIALAALEVPRHYYGLWRGACLDSIRCRRFAQSSSSVQISFLRVVVPHQREMSTGWSSRGQSPLAGLIVSRFGNPSLART